MGRRIPVLLAAISTLLVTLAVTGNAFACGPTSDCRLGDRYYRIKMPEGHDGKTPVGAIVFAHGYKGNGRGWVRNKRLVGLASELGVAIIGLKSFGDGWSLPGSPSDGAVARADEVAYVEAVLDDAAARFPLDQERLLATGFSAGGMMVWTLACNLSERFVGFAPMAGTFWEPTPATCTAPPASVVHVHGDADRTVPLTGRRIGAAKQGVVADVLAMYRRHGSFTPEGRYTAGRLRCERARNASGNILDFCLFQGGHRFSVEDVRHVWSVLVPPTTP